LLHRWRQWKATGIKWEYFLQFIHPPPMTSLADSWLRRQGKLTRNKRCKQKCMRRQQVASCCRPAHLHSSAWLASTSHHKNPNMNLILLLAYLNMYICPVFPILCGLKIAIKLSERLPFYDVCIYVLCINTFYRKFKSYTNNCVKSLDIWYW